MSEPTVGTYYVLEDDETVSLNFATETTGGFDADTIVSITVPRDCVVSESMLSTLDDKG
ncbi:MAG: hypothetical protein R3A47_04520 [Polyangiales bacterium]